jgi:hypothetical protein
MLIEGFRQAWTPRCVVDDALSPPLPQAAIRARLPRIVRDWRGRHE